MRNDASQLRKERLVFISKSIAKTMPNGADYERLLTQIQMEIGLSRPRAVEYVELVLKAHNWLVDGGTIKAEAVEA